MRGTLDLFFFGSKFTSSAEGRRFNWLIYDSMTSLFVCGRFSKSRGLSASVSFLPSFPFLFPPFYSLHSSPCNSLLPNCTETLATQATNNVNDFFFTRKKRIKRHSDKQSHHQPIEKRKKNPVTRFLVTPLRRYPLRRYAFY